MDTHPAIKIFSFSDEAGFNRVHDTLIHASVCRYCNCRRVLCHRMKKIIQHTIFCKKRRNFISCEICQGLLQLCYYHSQQCANPNTCRVVFCGNFRMELDLAAEIQYNSDKELTIANNHLIHASQCHDIYCRRPMCHQMKGAILHQKYCKATYSCILCQNLKNIYCYHLKECTAVEEYDVQHCIEFQKEIKLSKIFDTFKNDVSCKMPFCEDIRAKDSHVATDEQLHQIKKELEELHIDDDTPAAAINEFIF